MTQTGFFWMAETRAGFNPFTEFSPLDAPEFIAAGSSKRVEIWSRDGLKGEAEIVQSTHIRGRK